VGGLRAEGVAVSPLLLEEHGRRGHRSRLGRDPDYLEIDGDFARGAPSARASVFLKIEEFLNLNVYSYKVDVGEAKEKK